MVYAGKSQLLYPSAPIKFIELNLYNKISTCVIMALQIGACVEKPFNFGRIVG